MRKRGDRVIGVYRTRGRWEVRFIEGGRRYYTYCETEGEAERAAAAVRARLEDQEHLTVEDVLPAWLDSLADGAAVWRTRRTASIHVRSVLPLDESVRLSPKRCAALWAEAQPKLSAASQRVALGRLHGFARYLIGRGLLSADPFVGLKGKGRPRKGVEAHPQLTMDEMPLFFAALAQIEAQSPESTSYLAAACCYALGRREADLVGDGNLPGCRVRDLSADGRLLRGTGKGSRAYTVPVPIEAWGYPLRERLVSLARVKLPMAPLFESSYRPGRSVTLCAVTRAAKAICKAAGLPEVTTHGLRASLTSHGHEAGLDVDLLAQIQGHSVAMAREHYATQDSQTAGTQRRALRAIDGGKK